MSEKINNIRASESGGEGRTSSIFSEVLKWIGRANSVSETATGSKATKILGPIITVRSISKDAVETNFTDPEQVANFMENPVQNGVESTPVLGPALGVNMDNSKKENGILNTDNLVKSYQQSHNQNMQMYQRILKLNTKQKEK